MLLKSKHLTYFSVARAPWLAKIYKKQKELATDWEKLAKIYVIEIKIFSLFSVGGGLQKKSPRKWASEA
jgi:hypothetical protein